MSQPSTPPPSESAQPSETFTVELPPDLDAPTMARTLVRERAPGLPPNMVDDAVICVSELVSNAVEHGRPEIVMTLSVHDGRIGIEVTDHGDPIDPVVVGHVDDANPRGRGLRIIDTLADAWGVTRHDDNSHRPRKTVWFELYPA